MISRVDFLFSYWIFLWYLLYELKIIKNSPKGITIIATIHDALIFFYGLLYSIFNNSLDLLISSLMYGLMNIIIKVIPLIRMKNEIVKKEDMYLATYLFGIYLLWIGIINEYDIIRRYKQIYKNGISINENSEFFGTRILTLKIMKFLNNRKHII